MRTTGGRVSVGHLCWSPGWGGSDSTARDQCCTPLLQFGLVAKVRPPVHSLPACVVVSGDAGLVEHGGVDRDLVDASAEVRATRALIGYRERCGGVRQ